jgi:hypothetical protein
MKNTEENSEKIGKIQTKIVKRYGKYGRNSTYFSPVFFISFHYSANFSSILSKSYHYSTFLSANTDENCEKIW